MYTGLGAGGVTDATTLAPIDALTPNPLPAGPGQQEVTVHSQGLQEGWNLTFAPVDYLAITNPTTQGYGGPLYAVSADGTSARCLVDFRGNVAQWSAQVMSPYTNQQSPEFLVETVAGAAAPVDTNDYYFESGQMTPVLVVATTRLVAAQNAQGQPTNYVVVTGGSSGGVYQPGGASTSLNFPGPGILVNDPGAWRFVPAGPAAAAIVVQRFGASVIPQCTGPATGQDLVDPFGLPIITPDCPASLAWVDLQGNTVTSPWSTSAPPIEGTPIVTTRPYVYTPPASTSPVAMPASPPGSSSGGGGVVVTGPDVSTAPSVAPVLLAPSPALTPIVSLLPSASPSAASSPDLSTLLLLGGGLAAVLLLARRRP